MTKARMQRFERLLNRPLECRWVRVPSPRKVGTVVAFLVSLDRKQAEVTCPAKYKQNWNVDLNEVTFV